MAKVLPNSITRRTMVAGLTLAAASGAIFAKATRRRLARSLLDRPEPFSVIEGTFGHLSPVIGAASIPLLVKYSNDKEILFKD